jgi:hypothetical protein
MANYNMIEGLMDDVIGKYDGFPTVVTLRDDSGEDIVVDLSELPVRSNIFLEDSGFFSKEGEDKWEYYIIFGVSLRDCEMAAVLDTLGGGKLSN